MKQESIAVKEPQGTVRHWQDERRVKSRFQCVGVAAIRVPARWKPKWRERC
jgi:hypothetical protein